MKITHKPSKYFYQYYEVEVSTIDEAVIQLIPRLREKSQAFYKDELVKDLTNEKMSVIDHHAGNGCFYSIKMI
jgi:hypothetical protein